MTTTLITGANEDSVRAAAERVPGESGGLDVLVNDAGIAGDRKPLPEVTAQDVRVTRAFLPLLERSSNPVIVNVSSGMGSLAVTSDPERLESTLVALPYPAAKAAVNMPTAQYAKAFPQMRINWVDPGYTATDLNGHRGLKTVAQGARIIVAMAKLDQAAPTGALVDEHGVATW